MNRKPKIIGTCPDCKKENIKLVRNMFCNTCYIRKVHSGLVTLTPKKVFPANLTQRQEEILNGHMLGDGCLYQHKGKGNAHLAIRRKSTDKNYLEWTKNEFIDLYQSFRSFDTFDKRTNKTYSSWSFTTSRCEVLTKKYQDWYPKTNKIIPIDKINFTPLTLAVWFCDDGCAIRSEKRKDSPARLRIKLSTMGFSEEENEFLIEILSERYKEHFSKVKEDNKFFIVSSDAGARAFLKEIDSVMPDGMERKSDIWRHPDVEFYNANVFPAARHHKNWKPGMSLTVKELQILSLFEHTKSITSLDGARILNWAKIIKSKLYNDKLGFNSSEFVRVASHLVKKGILELGAIHTQMKKDQTRTNKLKSFTLKISQEDLIRMLGAKN